MRIRIKLLFFVLFFSFGGAVQSQIPRGGYLGYKHELSVDLFNVIYEEYGLEYKRFINNSVALHINPALVNYGREIYEGSFSLERVGQFERSSIIVNVGFVAAYYRNTGMALPVGYYLGYSFGKEIGTVTNDYFSATTFIPQGQYTYDHNGNIINMVVGRGIHLFENLVLDINLNLSLGWGRLTPQNQNSADIVPYLSRKIIQQNSSMEFTDDGSAYRYLTIYTYPKIKLGLLF